MEKTIYLDIERCVGCGACVIACMDQNDIYPEKGQIAFRTIYQLEDGHHPATEIFYMSVACMHCEDSPCITGCPTGAISRDAKTNAVVVNKDLCIGCHSCALACPFGVPRYDMDGKLQKCTMCTERVEAGLKPACVRVCPFDALKFEPINELQEDKQLKYVTNMVTGIRSSKTTE